MGDKKEGYLFAVALPPARRRLRLGMVGGGSASLIRESHRMAARLDLPPDPAAVEPQLIVGFDLYGFMPPVAP